jgi:hypothetical protein
MDNDNTMPLTLWTLDDIAAYYRRSTRQARRIVATPGFPPPARGDSSRWPAKHVLLWAESEWQPEPVTVTVLPRRVAPKQRIERKRARA